MDESDEFGSAKKDIKKIIIHPGWNPFDPIFDADISIIFMNSPVQYSQYIQPISVWEFSDDFRDIVGQQGFFAGL